MIDRLGLHGCFDGLTYCDYTIPDFDCKPERKSFERAMRDAGVVHGSNCFLVDDSAANIDTAMDLGWTAVHVADNPEVSNFGHFQISEIIELQNVLPHLWDQKRVSPMPHALPSPSPSCHDGEEMEGVQKEQQEKKEDEDEACA